MKSHFQSDLVTLWENVYPSSQVKAALKVMLFNTYLLVSLMHQLCSFVGRYRDFSMKEGTSLTSQKLVFCFILVFLAFAWDVVSREGSMRCEWSSFNITFALDVFTVFFFWREGQSWSNITLSGKGKGLLTEAVSFHQLSPNALAVMTSNLSAEIASHKEVHLRSRCFVWVGYTWGGVASILNALVIDLLSVLIVTVDGTLKLWELKSFKEPLLVKENLECEFARWLFFKFIVIPLSDISSVAIFGLSGHIHGKDSSRIGGNNPAG